MNIYVYVEGHGGRLRSSVSVVRYIEGHGGLLRVVDDMLKGMAACFVL